MTKKFSPKDLLTMSKDYAYGGSFPREEIQWESFGPARELNYMGAKFAEVRHVAFSGGRALLQMELRPISLDRILNMPETICGMHISSQKGRMEVLDGDYELTSTRLRTRLLEQIKKMLVEGKYLETPPKEKYVEGRLSQTEKRMLLGLAKHKMGIREEESEKQTSVDPSNGASSTVVTLKNNWNNWQNILKEQLREQMTMEISQSLAIPKEVLYGP